MAYGDNPAHTLNQLLSKDKQLLSYKNYVKSFGKGAGMNGWIFRDKHKEFW